MDISYRWRGAVTDAALNALHAEGFAHPLRDFHVRSCGFSPTSAGLVALWAAPAPAGAR